MVRVTDRDIDGGMAGGVQAQENESLAELISRYLIRLGLDSAFTSGIIVQLLTKGKVRVDFSKVVERLELTNLNDCMTAPQAMELFENYVTSMRTKEDAHDYRYIPDPDLMPHTPTGEWLTHVKECMVELPLARKQRLMSEYQLPEGAADVFVADSALADYFEEAAKGVANQKAVANWIINNLQAKLTESDISLSDLKFAPTAFSELVGFVESGRISSKIAQKVFTVMFSTGKSPAEIVEEKGLVQLSDTGELERFCVEAIEANPGPSEDYRKGKEAALNFLKGQVMKASQGKANPKMVGDLLKIILTG